MLVPSDRLGLLEVADDKVLSFPEGLLGFPADTRFVLVDVEGEEAYRWLQSVDDPGLSFLTVIPWPFFPDYEPVIDPEIQRQLRLTDAEDTVVLCTVTVRQGDPAPVTANLLGPLVINASTGLGRQVVLTDSGYPTRAELGGGG